MLVTHLFAAAALTIACGPGPTPHPAPSPRVVSLAPAATAIVDHLGAGDHLVGVTRYCHHPGVPVVGDMRPMTTKILAQRPDLVVIGDYAAQKPARDELEALSLRVLTVPLVTVSDMRAATTRLGAALGREQEARALNATVDAALKRATTRARGRRTLRVLWVFDVQQGIVYTTGGGDHLAEILAAHGAVNVAAGGPVTTRLSLETVVQKGPDVIIHAAPSHRFPDGAAATAFWKNLASIPAVAGGRIYVWPDDRLAQNGPWIASAIDGLGDLLDRAAGPK